MNCVIEQDAPVDLFKFVGQSAAILWKDWPKEMEAVSLGNGGFSLRGICPHPGCARPSVFINVSAAHAGIVPNPAAAGNFLAETIAIMQCQGCQKHILAMIQCPQNQSVGHRYKEHWPLGSPSQDVAEEIPEHIREDFKEAQRCIFVDAYNAAAEMCRRALEASCINLGAPKNKVLDKMIDWLEEKRIITPYLKDAAHKIRLGGNMAAHAHPDGSPVPAVAPDAPIEKIEKEHAEAIIEFAREFFHHVYVGPKMLSKYDFSKPKAAKP